MPQLLIRCMVGLWLMMWSFAAISADLRVKAGETYIVSSDQSRIDLDHLHLEDGASIKFAPGVSRWWLRARHADIGKGVLIDGAGDPGENGTPGVSRDGQAEPCEDGVAGEPGEPGGKGGSGVAITLDLKLARFGSLTIDTQGGEGGSGGKGGRGQQAGDVDKCNQTRGGPGGSGGDGGDGGNGGNVRFRYGYLTESLAQQPIDKNLILLNSGGIGAVGAEGGAGGAASEGHYINKKTLSGNRKWVPGGKPGPSGPSGSRGRSGLDGQLLVEEELVPLVAQLKQPEISKRADQIGDDGVADLLVKVTELQEKQIAQDQKIKVLHRQIRLINSQLKSLLRE